uniref:Proteasome activator complex subunit 4-like HEAT repeat-like domain-containing protein n=2 Tax=Caenorhabditis japonica TaxID=281687 RepID=A0A8R1IDV9_CAEJA
MPLQMFTETLKKTLNSKDRKEKLMAAELFLGIVQGLKHRTFVEQNAFWTEMTPRLNEFFNVMDEAEDAWTVAIKSVLYQDSDLRRLWWFIESLITGVKKTTTTNDVVQAFRLRCLLFRRWRYGEIVKRVVAIAWSKLPFSITDSLRNAIACVLRSSTLVRETNATASLVNVDSRFYPETLDETMRKFIEQIPMLKVDNEGTVKSSRSDPTLTSFRERETGRRRSSSPAMSENKM